MQTEVLLKLRPSIATGAAQASEVEASAMRAVGEIPSSNNLRLHNLVELQLEITKTESCLNALSAKFALKKFSEKVLSLCLSPRTPYILPPRNGTALVQIMGIDREQAVMKYKGVGRVDGELGKATSQLDQLERSSKPQVKWFSSTSWPSPMGDVLNKGQKCLEVRSGYGLSEVRHRPRPSRPGSGLTDSMLGTLDDRRVACLGRPLNDRRVVRCSDRSTCVVWVDGSFARMVRHSLVDLSFPFEHVSE
ncbi:hypothetical protein DY000_02007110 [Brassica cretica]|uniref:Uncharacterized protein n=1 Tax=Brassica cretica TaxID=69181 RepID=A0ABQ7CET0_BRACR|nr:hypothetical protein DY000_02007110 [Brassica cretica]